MLLVRLLLLLLYPSLQGNYLYNSSSSLHTASSTLAATADLSVADSLTPRCRYDKVKDGIPTPPYWLLYYSYSCCGGTALFIAAAAVPANIT